MYYTEDMMTPTTAQHSLWLGSQLQRWHWLGSQLQRVPTTVGAVVGQTDCGWSPTVAATVVGIPTIAGALVGSQLQHNPNYSR
jgi:hypothetical protein